MTMKTNVFPTYPEPMLKPIKGKGAWIWDEQGKSYLDFTSGIGVCQLGHAPEKVKEKIIQQLDQLWHTSNLFEIAPQQQLATELTELSGFDFSFFANSGAEANEAAIKLARRYQQKIKGTKRYEIISFENSFHGRTLATLTATGQAKVKDGFSPLPYGFVSVPYGNIAALKKAIHSQTAAILLEVVQGEGGVRPAELEWLKEVEMIANDEGLLLIIDEVQTGIGRTGEWFGFQHYGIQPDVITLAKGLGSGIPIGAMLAKKKYKEAFSLGSHGSTFGGNFISTTAGLATIHELKEQLVVEGVKAKGSYLLEQLNTRLQAYPQFKEVRGKGLMIGIEWDQAVQSLVGIAKENGILLLTAGPNVIRLLPPLNISDEELEQGIERLLKSIHQWLEK